MNENECETYGCGVWPTYKDGLCMSHYMQVHCPRERNNKMKKQSVNALVNTAIPEEAIIKVLRNKPFEGEEE